MATPINEPIRGCELEAGKPKYQVPRFQIMAATSNANTIANPALLPTCKISSTGNREMIPKATNPLEVNTPRKFQNPDRTKPPRCAAPENGYRSRWPQHWRYREIRLQIRIPALPAVQYPAKRRA